MPSAEVARRPRIHSVAFALLLIAASIAPIRSYDYFWHLATGRWIVEHHALPIHDPFAVASDRTPWINGEWLFQVPLYALQNAVGDSGVSLIRSILVGLVFFGVFVVASRKRDYALIALLTAVALAGGMRRLGVRPETAAAALLAVSVAVLLHSSGTRRLLILGITGIVWTNVHPSALLLPALCALAAIGDVVESRGVTRNAKELSIATVVTSATLLMNPFGIEGILAPLRLARFAQSGLFVNSEWLPSFPSRFPLLYIAIAIAVALFVAGRDRSDATAAILLAFLSIIAIRFLRNQGFFFAAYPLLVAAPAARVDTGRLRQLLLAVSLLVPAAVAATHLPFDPAVDDEYFPVRAVDRMIDADIAGHVYNPDQFGGYLIWRLYPQRRALTDGRNELYRNFLREYERARHDGRAWKALLDRYQIAAAVDEYRPDRIEVIDPSTGKRTFRAAARVFFPPREWALVAFDDVAMVFARRNTQPAGAIAAHEYRWITPDDPSALLAIPPGARSDALREIERGCRESGEGRVCAAMREMVAESR